MSEGSKKLNSKLSDLMQVKVSQLRPDGARFVSEAEIRNTGTSTSRRRVLLDLLGLGRSERSGNIKDVLGESIDDSAAVSRRLHLEMCDTSPWGLCE